MIFLSLSWGYVHEINPVKGEMSLQNVYHTIRFTTRKNPFSDDFFGDHQRFGH